MNFYVSLIFSLVPPFFPRHHEARSIFNTYRPLLGQKHLLWYHWQLYQVPRWARAKSSMTVQPNIVQLGCKCCYYSGAWFFLRRGVTSVYLIKDSWCLPPVWLILMLLLETSFMVPWYQWTLGVGKPKSMWICFREKNRKKISIIVTFQF